MKSKIIEQITKTTSEMIEFKNKIKEENRIIQENGFFFKKDRYPDEVIFINPCGNDERNFDKFSEFIKKETDINVSSQNIKELYYIQQDGFKAYVNVDENHYLFCPIKDNGFSIAVCVGNQETLKA